MPQKGIGYCKLTKTCTITGNAVPNTIGYNKSKFVSINEENYKEGFYENTKKLSIIMFYLYALFWCPMFK